jgi:hypothetical protein
MQKEEAFGATRVMSMLYGGFFKDVAKEIGTEKAVALHARGGEAFGHMLAGMLQAQAADKGLNIATLSSVLSAAPAVFGMTPEVEDTATSVKLHSHQCPMYEGWKEAGLDHETIGSLCRAMAAAEYAALTKAIPQVSARLEFRSAPDKACVEHYTLAR